MNNLKVLAPREFWDFLQEKCIKCYNKNKDRPNPRTNAGSVKINLCKKHKKDMQELFNELKENKN
jgi:hypothetical protein